MFFGRSPVLDTQASSGNIHIENVRSDRPEFHRIYTATVGDGFHIKVEMKWFLGSRFDSSMITQKDGKYIFFQAHEVADKIIDRELYPLVQKAVDEILREDKRFIDSNPAEYIDQTGTTWRRAQ